MSIKSSSSGVLIPTNIKNMVEDILSEKSLTLLKHIEKYQVQHNNPDDVIMLKRMLVSGIQQTRKLARPFSVLSFMEDIGSVFVKFTDSSNMYSQLVQYIPFRLWPSCSSAKQDITIHFKNMITDFLKIAEDRIDTDHISWGSLEKNLEMVLMSILVELLLLDVVQKIVQQMEQVFADVQYKAKREQLYAEMDSVFVKKAYLFETVMPKKIEQVFEAMTFISAFMFLAQKQLIGLSEKNGFIKTIEPTLIFLLKIYKKTCANNQSNSIEFRFKSFANRARVCIFQNGQLGLMPALELIWAQKETPEYLELVLAYFLANPYFAGKLIQPILQATGKNTAADQEYLKTQKNVVTCLALWIKKNGPLHGNPFENQY